MKAKNNHRRSYEALENMFQKRIIKAYVSAMFLSWLLLSLTIPPHAGASDLINCQIHEAQCKQTLENCEVTLDIQPKPVKAMTDLLFHVSITGKTPSDHPYIDLGMPGMKMGPNRVKMKPVGKNAYEGRGVIVRCPSGRRTWFAKVTVPGLGEVEYVFDVIY